MTYTRRKRRRDKRWEIKTRPDLWHPRLEALHEVSSQLVGYAYRSIDKLYEQVARVLDEEGILIQARMLYRCFAEEMWKAKTKYRGEALRKTVEAIQKKYELYGCDPTILRRIKSLLALPYTIHIDVYVAGSPEVKVGEGDIVVMRKAVIYVDGVKVGEMLITVTPTEAPVMMDGVEVGRLSV